MYGDCNAGYNDARANDRYTNSWGDNNCMRAWVDNDGCVRMQYAPALDDGNDSEQVEYYNPDDDDDDYSEVDADAINWYPRRGAQACMEGTALAFVRSDSGKRALEVYARRAGWLNDEDATQLRDENERLKEKIAELTGEDYRDGMTFLQASLFAAMIQGAGGGWQVDRIAHDYYNPEQYRVYAVNRGTGASWTFAHPVKPADLAARLGLANESLNR